MKVHFAIPYAILKERLREVISLGLCPEIYFDAKALKDATPEELDRLKRTLREAKLTCSIHGPYMDLSPGAMDPGVRDVTLRRFMDTLRVSEILEPLNIVFHPGYIPMVHREYLGLWMEKARELWLQVFEEARRMGLRVSLENVFDDTPEVLHGLLSGMEGEVGFCLDPAHQLLYSSTPLQEWIRSMGDFLTEVHIHNNHGFADEHLPPDEGVLDFGPILKGLPGDNLLLTLEVHQEEKVLKGFRVLQGLLEEIGWRN
ncbi:MAG: hypothetical protein DRG31_03935 [Deltaproteobacteria bacterium]|nr:MAG: hypothetical protein DRG31_03935 [Deltaproteobacteria bacterium]